jgi:Flp pilus assembly protein TadG
MLPIIMKNRRRGSAIVEFTLTGIPLLFIWISCVQMALGMWNYASLQNAVKQTGNYIAVHGADCSKNGNSCTVNVSNVISTFETYAIGIAPASVSVTLTSASGTTVTCSPVTSCSTNSTTWPPTADASVGSDIKVRADYTFRTALSMVAPGGSGVVKFGTSNGLGVFDFPGYTHQRILF